MSKAKLEKKLSNIGFGNVGVLKSATMPQLKQLLETGQYKPPAFSTIMGRYLSGEKKVMSKFYNWTKLNSVRFPVHGISYNQFQANPKAAKRSPNMYGDINYFINVLTSKLGPNWSRDVLDMDFDVSKIPGVKRLGVPGRQGTVIKLTDGGIDYAIKVAPARTSCGDGATGGMGFLKQARMQQLAAEEGATCPVYAVFCVPGKKERPFMVMPMMGQRMVDIYPDNAIWSDEHQKQFWNCCLTLDKKVGIAHNDINCLNVMTDPNGVVKLIDFDRSFLFKTEKVKKYGPFINMCFLPFNGCFQKKGKTDETKENGMLLLHHYGKLFNEEFKSLIDARMCTCMSYNEKEAVYLPPFKLVPPKNVYTQVYYLPTAIQDFCSNPTKLKFGKLPTHIQEIFTEVLQSVRDGRIKSSRDDLKKLFSIIL